MKVIVSGGGTGGHFFPALEVLREARSRGLETLYIGTSRGIEVSYEDSILGNKLFLNTLPFRGVSLWEKFLALKSFLLSSSKLVSRFSSADRVLLFGGYGSVPAGLASLLSGTTLYIHEQNSVPSSTNRTFSYFSRKVFITFEYSRRFFKRKRVIKTGLPVRKKLLGERSEPAVAKEKLAFDSKKPVILFMGGSQGAIFINTLAVEFAKRTGLQVLLISGRRHYEKVKEIVQTLENIRVFPFREDMGLIYSCADVCVCRAGAGTITELSLFGVPALFIPYPYAAGDHQYYNAKEIEELGGGVVLRQEASTPERVTSKVEQILARKELMSNSIRGFANGEASSLILDEIVQD